MNLLQKAAFSVHNGSGKRYSCQVLVISDL
jgi:hypothetical protein